MTTTDELLVALMRLSPEERLSVLELLPEWQRLTRTNDLRAIVRRETLDALIDVIVGAQKHATASEDPMNSLVRSARHKSARMRLEEREKASEQKPR